MLIDKLYQICQFGLSPYDCVSSECFRTKPSLFRQTTGADSLSIVLLHFLTQTYLYGHANEQHRLPCQSVTC